jgi:ABC-type antimicrobial peptide transport system permease subunit
MQIIPLSPEIAPDASLPDAKRADGSPSAFRVTPELLARGVAWAALIGLIGGLFPALRAARLPIASSLREL